MAYYQIKNIGKVGVITDLSPTDLPPNAFTDAINARFVGGQIKKFGGNKPISYNGAEDNITAYAIQPMPFDFQYDHPFNILGTADGLYSLEDQHWENISYWEPITSGHKTASVAVTSHPLMTGIEITEPQVNVKQGQSHDFYAELTPEGVRKTDLVWTLSTQALGTIKVDPEDPLHAVFTASTTGSGPLTVTVSNEDSTLRDFAIINVTLNIDAINLNQSTYNIPMTDGSDPNRIINASVIFTPANPVDQEVQWISSDTTVFTVQTVDAKTVKLLPLRNGSATLTVQMKNQTNIKATARVNVIAGVNSLELSQNSFALVATVGATPATLTVTAKPDDAPDKTFTWSKTTNEGATSITVSGNTFKITPIRAGRDVLQFVANDGGAVAACVINVSAAPVSARAMSFMAQDDFVEDSLVVDTVDLAPMMSRMMVLAAAPVANLEPIEEAGGLSFDKNLDPLVRFPIGKEFALEVSASGGSGSYSYQWYTGDSPTAGGLNQPKSLYPATTPVTVETRQVVITDAAGNRIVSEPCKVYVYDPAVATQITKVTLDKTVIDFDQGDEETITATVETNNGDIEHLAYLWSISKDGIITHDGRSDKSFTIYGLGNGSTTVTFNVWPTRQKAFRVTPENNWYHTAIANCAVFNTNTFEPLVKNFGDKEFKILPGWGEQTVVDAKGNWSVTDNDWKCERVRAFNNRLFALNMTESDSGGVERHYPQRVRWSNFATENSAPDLWDDLADLRDPEDNNSAVGTLKALVNGYAGYIDLADTQGDLVEMVPLKDYLFIYTEFETYVGTPTMNAYQPMTFKKLYNDSGILAPGCAVEVEGGHFVVTQNDIILHNGASKQSISDTIVKDHIIQEISSVNPAATRVYLHSDKKEVWICYVPPGMPKSTWFNSKAAVWNYEFQTWTFYEIPHTYEIVLTDPPTLDKTATWADFGEFQEDGVTPGLNLTWETAEPTRMPWQKNSSNFRKRITVGCSVMKGLYELDTGAYNHAGYKFDDLANIEPYVRPLKMEAIRQGIDFDNVTEEWRQKHINNFHFQVNGQGTIQVEAGGTQYSNERGHEHNYRDYIAGLTRSLSVRLNHPYLYYGIVDEDPLSTVTVSGLVIDFALGGRR